MQKFLYITALVLSALACGMQLPADTQVESEVSIDVKPTPEQAEITSIQMVVIADEGLNIRADHSEGSEDVGDLFPGEIVTVIEIKVIGESRWCLHERGWSNCRWLVVKN